MIDRPLIVNFTELFVHKIEGMKLPRQKYLTHKRMIKKYATKTPRHKVTLKKTFFGVQYAGCVLVP